MIEWILEQFEYEEKLLKEIKRSGRQIGYDYHLGRRDALLDALRYLENLSNSH